MAEYKIKDIETLTGIKSHTIRIWEKRYAILKPSRTDTKIRTYSDEDLSIILNVAILNKNGWKISHIADLTEEARIEKVLALQTDSVGDVYFEKLLLSLIKLDETSFENTINNLIKKHGFSTTFSKYLIQFLGRIGVMWLAGTINSGQEHFMSHLIRQKTMSELSKLPIPNPNSPKVLLFLPENEWHELSLLFYHYLLRSNGVYSFYLGQSLPYDSIEDCFERLEPKAIVTSIITSKGDEYYVKLFEKMTTQFKGIPIYVGGQQMINNEDALKAIIHPIHSEKDLTPLYILK